jgi:choline dehydrogenase-like flavoprotein
MPAQPSGASLVADFMGAWFGSQQGWNACYRAEINRDYVPDARRIEREPKPIGARSLVRRVESDVVIIGGGITAALVAQKLVERRPSWSVVDRRSRQAALRQREPHEVPPAKPRLWREPVARRLRADQSARGVISRTMAVGGSALHWGGVCNRFSRRRHAAQVLYGLAVDWPIDWKELETFYCEAERRIGVSGEPARSRGSAQRTLSDARDADDLQSDPAEELGGEERHQVLDDTAGEEHG